KFAGKLARRERRDPLLCFAAGRAIEHGRAHAKARNVYEETRFAFAAVVHKRNATASISRVRPSRSARAAAAIFVGRPIVRRKSLPVPPGRIASSASVPDSRIPLATSEIVPSPPQATINFVPRLAAALASSRAWPAASVNS